MQPFQWNALTVLAIAAGCLWMSWHIPYMLNFVVDVTVRSLAIASVFLGLILMFGLSDDVKNLVHKTLRMVQEYIT